MKSSISYVQWEHDNYMLRGTIHKPDDHNGIWVIVSHGFTSHRIGPNYLYVAMSKCLEKIGVSSLRFDYMGCGESDGAFQELTLETLKSDLLSAVSYIKKEYSPQKVIVFGHSLGGYIASVVCEDVCVDGLVMLAPVAEPYMHLKDYSALLELGPNDKGLYELGPYLISDHFLKSVKKALPIEKISGIDNKDMLLVRGQKDQKVLSNEISRYRDWAIAYGCKIKYIELENTDHRLSDSSKRTELCGTLLDWIKENYF